MTGFGRNEGQFESSTWVWELRAVNGKGLDVRLRLPNGYERLEPLVRKLMPQHMSRGNVQASLSITNALDRPKTVINRAALHSVIETIKDLEADTNLAPSSAADILALRGVLDAADEDISEEKRTQFHNVLLDGLKGALDSLNENRSVEGDALSAVLLDHLDLVEDLQNRAEIDPSRTGEAIAARLKDQLSRILEQDSSIDADRLHQEVALLATKADIREELDRLKAHVDAARNFIQTGSPIGRKLEFLAQEFNRESNTLCSKSNAVSLTEIGLELKVVIDQFREQILNVE